MAARAQWCDKHWGVVREGVEAGTMNGVAAGIQLFEEWLVKHEHEGTLPRPDQVSKLNKLLDKESPLCCFIGEEAMERVYAKARTIKAGSEGTETSNGTA